MKAGKYKIHQLFSMMCCVLIVLGACFLPWVQGERGSYSMVSYLVTAACGRASLREISADYLIHGRVRDVYLMVVGSVILIGVICYAVYFVVLLWKRKSLPLMVFVSYYEALVLIPCAFAAAALVPAILVALMFSEHFFGRMIEATVDLAQEKREKELLMNLRGELLEQNYREILELQQKSRKVFHDFKNEINVLTYHAEQGDLEKVKEYLHKIGNPVRTLESYVWTGNEMADLILNRKYTEALEKGIEFQVEAEKVGDFGVDDLKICVIFGNLLDNAIEAAEKAEEGRRWIRVHLAKHGAVTALSIVNSLRDVPEEEDGRLRSRKADGEVHGIGLESVRESVEETGVTLEITYDTETFEADVTFF